MSVITILSALAVTALQKDGGIEGVRQMLGTLVGGAAGNAFSADVHDLGNALAGWLRATRPDRNMDLERAVRRSGLHADLFCIVEALGEPLELPESRGERWLQLLHERTPERFRNPGMLREGALTAGGKMQLRLAREAILQRLKQIEDQFSTNSLDPDKLLGKEDKDYARAAAESALVELESAHGLFPEAARKLFLTKWFGYLCGSFHHELKHRQEVANIYLATGVAELKEGMAVLLERDKPSRTPFCYKLPALSFFVGREAELEEALLRWLDRVHLPLLVQGETGIGKSTLALALLHDPRAERMFGERRYRIRCDALPFAEHLKAAMGREWFGLEPNPNIGGQVLSFGGERPLAQRRSSGGNDELGRDRWATRSVRRAPR